MIIKNGWVIENNTLTQKDILIENNKIVQMGVIDSRGLEILDATGCLVMPGAVDVHVHLREPGFEHKETIQTGTLAAAKGGITTVMSMPNLNPCPDCKKHLDFQKQLIARDALVHVYPYGAVTVNESGAVLANIKEICQEVVAITDDGCGVNNIELLKQAMRLAKKYDLVIASHAEDSINGKLPEGEYNAVRREIELAKEIGCRYHFCHMSTKESFEAIRQAHKEGYLNITCEVSPHHLLLNETMIQDGNWKMNPPLRSEENRLATIEALLDGTACMIASDHAPHSEVEKAQDYEKCPNGIIGLETMIPAIYTYFIHHKRASYEDFIKWFVIAPCDVFRLPKRILEVGSNADIAVLDITHARKYTKEEIVSLGKNSPFIGQSFYGFAKYTLVDGQVVYQNVGGNK